MVPKAEQTRELVLQQEEEEEGRGGGAEGGRGIGEKEFRPDAR